MSKKIKKAFSLIELSIVILIIGILVAGVTQSSRLIKSMRLMTARNLTLSSPVNSIQNLVMWYETTLEKSIDEAERQDGIEVSKWYDITPTSITKNDATQTVLASRPKYTDGVINGLPVLKFDGSSDFFDIDGKLFVGSQYTIFVVEQRRTNADAFFFGGGSFGTNMCLIAGYYTGGASLRHAHFGDDVNDCLNCVPLYSTVIPRIHIFRFSYSKGKQYYLNGSTVTSQNATVNPLVSYNNAYIAKYGTSIFYYGDIAEIIVFSSALNVEELSSIKDYLSKKWGIKVN